MPLSNRKGGGFERWCAKSLSRWMTGGKRDDLLWRTAMSGGRATMQLRRGKINVSQLGDLNAIDPEGKRITNKFFIECKFRKKLRPFLSIATGGGGLFKYWKETCADCARVPGLLPLLIASENNQPVLLLTTREGAEVLQLAPILLAKLYGKWLHRPVYVVLFERMLKEPCPL